MSNKYKERYKDKNLEELEEVRGSLAGCSTTPEEALEAVEWLIRAQTAGIDTSADAYCKLDINDDYHLARKYASKITNTLSRHLDFSLSFNEYKRLLKTKKCYYTGVKFSEVKGMEFSLDRIDSNVGYTKENTVPALKAINAIKNALFEHPERGHSVDVDMVIKMCQKIKALS
jgi:hypothetical protein